MKGILLIAWLILYPLVDGICDYLIAKRKNMFQQGDYSKDVRAIGACIAIAFYIAVAVFICKNV